MGGLCLTIEQSGAACTQLKWRHRWAWYAARNMWTHEIVWESEWRKLLEARRRQGDKV